MPVNRRRLLLGSGSVIAAAGLGTRRTIAQESISIALDWYPNANHAGLFWADANGLFGKAGVDVDLVIPADPTTVLQTVAAGRDTFGISYQPDILLARAEELPIVALSALVPQPLLGVMSLAESGITRPADLAGRIVGYTGIPSQEAFLTTMLEHDGISVGDITIQNIGFNLLPTLISKQAVAVMGAYWTHETILAEQEGYPVSMLRVEEWGVPSYNELVLVASEETAANRPEMVEGVLAAIKQGYLAAGADQEAALDVLVSAYPETDRVVETVGIALLADLWLQPDPGFGVLSPEAWSTFAKWMIGAGLLPGNFDVSGTISSLAASPAMEATPTT